MRMLFQLTLLLAGLVLVTTSPSSPHTLASNRAVAQFRALANSQTFPRYDRVLLLETTSDTSANVSVGDLNGDGNLDIVLVKGRVEPLAVWDAYQRRRNAHATIVATAVTPTGERRGGAAGVRKRWWLRAQP